MKTKDMTNARLRRRKKIKKGLKYVVCIIVAVIMLFPMYWLFTTSFKTATNVGVSQSLCKPSN